MPIQQRSVLGQSLLEKTSSSWSARRVPKYVWRSELDEIVASRRLWLCGFVWKEHLKDCFVVALWLCLAVSSMSLAHFRVSKGGSLPQPRPFRPCSRSSCRWLRIPGRWVKSDQATGTCFGGWKWSPTLLFCWRPSYSCCLFGILKGFFVGV